MLPWCCAQVRAELSTAETSLATATAERLQLQQELNTKWDQLMLLESELRLKTSRLDASQQQLSNEAEEHAAERALLQRQLEQLVVSCAGVHVQATRAALCFECFTASHAWLRIDALHFCPEHAQLLANLNADSQ
jgi:ABC-type phosphate transport system auxiliary subunit